MRIVVLDTLYDLNKYEEVNTLLRVISPYPPCESTHLEEFYGGRGSKTYALRYFGREIWPLYAERICLRTCRALLQSDTITPSIDV